MNNAMVVKVRDGRQSRTYEIGSVRLIIAPFPTYSIEQFAAKGEISDEVYYVLGATINIGGTATETEVLFTNVQLFIVSK